MQNALDILDVEKGEIMHGLSCEQAFIFGDLLIINNGLAYHAFEAKDFKLKARKYQIDKEEVLKVFLPKHLNMVVLQTKSATYIRDYENKDLNKNNTWQDHFIEPYSGQFYRMDVHGIWYDIEGVALGTPVFVQEEVLCSLCGKHSKKSFSFKEQNLKCNPSSKIIQLGKLVFDEKLRPIIVRGQRVTHLGSKHIHLGSRHLQEVYFGLNQKAFIDEEDKSIFAIEGKPVLDHVGAHRIGKHRFEIFRTQEQDYTFNGRTGKILIINNEPAELDLSTFVEFDERVLVLNKEQHNYGYIDIHNSTPYYLKHVSSEMITYIDPKPQVIEGLSYRNISTGEKQFVYDEINNEVLKLDEVHEPTEIEIASFYPSIFGIAKIDGKSKYFYLKDRKILKLSPNNDEVSKVLETGNEKLRNALNSNGEQIVLDLREGLNEVKQAQSFNQIIQSVQSEVHYIGDAALQNATLKTLGGSQERVIDLNEISLSIFTLPSDLHLFPDQAEKASMFQLNPISTIDFENPVQIKEETFYPAIFIPFNGNPTAVIIQKGNGRPLHLASAGNKNELVQSFKEETLQQKYFIGPHRMIGLNTLTEDLSEQKLMMSFPDKRTFLPFEEIVLPVIADVKNYSYATEWSYHLFEIRSSKSGSDFIAVEKVAPYRILVEKNKGVELPKLVKETGNTLRSPEEISRFRKLFIEDPGYLKEI